MIDRKDYLSGKVSHREWYAQFVTSETINRVSLIIGKDRIKASIDPYFNDIPLYEWDAIVKTYGVTSRIREAGDYPTLGNGVCILKEAAQQIREKL